ncbi:MAG: PH domain-containing protein [Stackebrandtia sp.]
MSDSDETVDKRRTFRDWRKIVVMNFGAIMAVGCAADLLRRWALDLGASPETRYKAGLLGFAFIGVACMWVVLSLRPRTVVDATGLTSIEVFSRRRVEWQDVKRLEVEKNPNSWLIRARLKDGSVVVFRRVRIRWWRKIPVSLSVAGHETWRMPPPEAPKALRVAFDEIKLRRRACRARADKRAD